MLRQQEGVHGGPRICPHSSDPGSMHLTLSAHNAKYVIDQGWGEDHYLVTQGHWPKGLVMIFSPRDDEELEQVKTIVAKSFEFASGKSGQEEL